MCIIRIFSHFFHSSSSPKSPTPNPNLSQTFKPPPILNFPPQITPFPSPNPSTIRFPPFNPHYSSSSTPNHHHHPQIRKFPPPISSTQNPHYPPQILPQSQFLPIFHNPQSSKAQNSHFQTLPLPNPKIQIPHFFSINSLKMAPTKPMSLQVVNRGYHGFRSQPEYEWWARFWDKRPVVRERPLDAGSFDVNEFPQSNIFLNKPGWDGYFKAAGNTCNYTICSEFMASLLPVPNTANAYVARVRNKNVELNLRTLSELMGIEPLEEGQFDFPSAQPPDDPTPDQLATFVQGRDSHWPFIGGKFSYLTKRDVCLNCYLLYLVVLNSMLPTTTKNRVYLQTARMMEAIASNRQICLVRFFLSRIVSMIGSTSFKDSIKMGVLITRLCAEKYSVEWRQTDRIENPLQILSKATKNRIFGQFRTHPEDAPGAVVEPALGGEQNEGDDGESGDEEGDGTEQGLPAAADIPTSSQFPRRRRRTDQGPVDMDMNALMGRLDLMQNTMTGLYGDFRDYRAENRVSLASIHDRVGVVEARIQSFEERQQAADERVMDLRTDFNAYRGEWYEWMIHQPPPPEE